MDYEEFIETRCKNAVPLLVVIRGSNAYGTNLPNSDIDYAGIYIQAHEDILGNKYVEQISDKKGDIVFYEIRRFLELIATNNPNMLEMLATPKNCIIYKHDVMDVVLNHPEKFITKRCAATFSGYAYTQINKAEGLDKKQNWEAERFKRKTPSEFCYVHIGTDSIPLKTYLTNNNLSQENIGLMKMNHQKDLYGIFVGNYRGITFDDSNDVHLSNIEKDANLTAYLSYNKDGYSEHCKEYNQYMEWQKNRNEDRYVDVLSHGQKIDGKNLMHCKRLLDMAKEIAGGEGIKVWRENYAELINIRKGMIDLKTLIEQSKKDIEKINELFKSSNLPNKIEDGLIHNILVSIRKQIYQVHK